MAALVSSSTGGGGQPWRPLWVSLMALKACACTRPCGIHGFSLDVSFMLCAQSRGKLSPFKSVSRAQQIGRDRSSIQNGKTLGPFQGSLRRPRPGDSAIREFPEFSRRRYLTRLDQPIFACGRRNKNVQAIDNTTRLLGMKSCPGLHRVFIFTNF
jgi:hypothetical protein